MDHLKVTLEDLRQHQLYAKKTNYKFGRLEAAYLGHIISTNGVDANLENLQAMKDWPFRNSLKALRGFWDSWVIIRDSSRAMGALLPPLIEMLKKDKFK